MQMFKRIVSLVLALMMMLSMVPHQAFATETEPVSAEETMPAVEATQAATVAETAEIPAVETLVVATEFTEEEATASTEVVAEDAAAAESGSLGDNLNWTLDDSGVLTVSGSGAMSSGTTPWAGKKSSIKAVVIGSGVTTIAARAFSGCPLLTAVDIQGTITSIGSGAFAGCTALAGISIPEGLVSIGQAAFFECSKLKTINLPASLASISVQAFGECTSLTDVYYGGKASEWTAISIATDNDYLTNATLHCTLVSQSGNCGDNLQWELEEGVLTVLGTGNMIDCSSDTVPWKAVRNDIICVEIAPGVTSIGKSAFSVCMNLEEVTVSEGVTSIGIAAFLECRKLTTITLPGTLTQIGDYAFCDSGIKAVAYDGTIDTWAKINIGEENTALTNAVIRYTGSADALAGSCGENVSWKLENGVLTISGSGAMNNYTYSTLPWGDVRESIKEVVVESGVTTIGNSAFSGCTSLSSISLPDTLKSIGVSAFATCTALTEIAIPEGVTSIGNAAFLECAGLSKLQLPKSVESIGAFAFDGCPVSDVYYAGTGEKWGLVNVGECNDTLLGATIHHSALCGQGHDFSEWEETNAPTCTQVGEAIHTCTACGIVESKEVPATGHTEVIDKAVAPTCTETGLTEGKHCSVCNEVLVAQTVVKANGHAEVIDAAVAPTCTETGLTEGKHCSVCNEVLVAQTVVKANGHTEVIDTAVAPTCTETGLTEGKHCSVCNEILIAQTVVKANGHTEVIDTAVAPTCTETGLTEGKHCSVCNEVLVAQTVVKANGHTEVTDKAVTPTCTETGLTEGKHCSVCNKVLVAQTVVKANGHTEVIDTTVAPTCTETGLTEGKHCSACNEVLAAQELVAALGHSYDEGVFTTEPGCETEGLKTFTCTTCGDAYTETVTATGHTGSEAITENEVAATCTTAGSYDSVVCCVVCGTELSRETINVDALGHTEAVDEAVVPTCTDTGLTEGKHCAVCNEVLIVQEEIPAIGHDYIVGICQNCGDTIKADYEIYAGKSLTLKVINPETNKTYTAKQLIWTLAEEYAPFATVSKAGKVTAKKVVEKSRIQVVGTVTATQEIISYIIDIYPAVTQLEVKRGEEIVNGKTVLMDFTEERITLKADAYPLDTLENVTWTVSDKKAQYAEYETEGDTLTISNPKGKAGTVTVKVTVDAGVKKTVTVKIQFGSFAKTMVIDEPEKTTLRGGESMKLTASITEPESVTKPGVVWSTSDKNAATVSNGKVTAKNVAHPTLVTITATSKDGQASASVKLKIVPKNEGQLVLMQDGAYATNSTHAMNVGDTYQVTTSRIENGAPVSETATWSTSKATVATVENGLITAVGAGTAKITAECNGMKAVINIKVSTLVADMEITTKDGKNIIEENEEKVVLVSSGKSVNLVANVNAGANKAVTWEITEGAAYAKVSNGKVTANKDLTKPVYITVKATAKDGSGTNAIIRVKIVPLATGVQIFQNGSRVRSNTVFVYDMLQGNTLKLSAKVYPAKANQAVQLTSSSKKIADFNENGELVCFKTGTVTITAKALDGSNAKTTFKLTIVKKVQSLTLKEGSVLTVTGGKSLKLAPCVEISPSDATNKKLNWKVSENDYGITISASGVLKTKKVTYPVTVNVMVTTQDGSGTILSFDVTVNPT